MKFIFIISCICGLIAYSKNQMFPFGQVPETVGNLVDGLTNATGGSQSPVKAVTTLAGNLLGNNTNGSNTTSVLNEVLGNPGNSSSPPEDDRFADLSRFLNRTVDDIASNTKETLKKLTDGAKDISDTMDRLT